jgi:Putative peptidoglycan binding domain
MNRTLRYGARGDDVAKLQEGLNLMPSSLARLNVDGIYGAKTVGRVQEFQHANALTPDGIVGPLTWGLFLDLLAQLQSIVPAPPPVSYDVLRPMIIKRAEECIGKVDFSKIENGKPRGIDFLKTMYHEATKTRESLSDAQFWDNSKKIWVQEPLLHGKRKSWCGIFCIYCYRKAGILSVTWDLENGKPSGPIDVNGWSANFVAGIKQADMGVVQHKSHHFLIESVEPGKKLPRMTTIDGNQDFGRIIKIKFDSGYPSPHQVLKDNFNYYSFK